MQQWFQTHICVNVSLQFCIKIVSGPWVLHDGPGWWGLQRPGSHAGEAGAASQKTQENKVSSPSPSSDIWYCWSDGVSCLDSVCISPSCAPSLTPSPWISSPSSPGPSSVWPTPPSPVSRPSSRTPPSHAVPGSGQCLSKCCLEPDLDLDQVLGGAGRVQPGRAAAGPGHQPPGLLLPHLPHPQVRLPGLVHGPGGVERERRHLQ